MSRNKIMTETEWLECTEPARMLELLRTFALDRKLRLFCCACCRRIWALLTAPESRMAVEVAERWADNLATTNELRVARKRAMRARSGNPSEDSANASGAASSFKSAFGAAQNGYLHAIYAVVRVASRGNSPSSRETSDKFVQALDDGYRDACVVLREIVGNPFRPVSFDSAQRTLTVVGLAQTAYDERILPGGTLDPDRLAVLADALEDTGCTDAAILDHLRGPEPHVRGCFVVDLLLGKEQT